ncbi:uncharacterized protein LOC126674780 [Mercurialis annua]|uniref:uncharacterized protein LOC126674780 n=1 Tax=Mercurialis annua TaxID=3986 RepID=UPI00215DFEFC|nr:uncharacterized protein LOC126674780 [Mercurialis annua]
MNWKHHTLIQSLMSRGPLNYNDFLKIFAAVTGKNPSKSDGEVNAYLLKINKELSYVQMELRQCRNQNDGEVYYGIVNSVADDQSKLGTRFSAPQITLFKGVIDAIVQDTAAQGSISTIEALNLRLENQVYSVTESQSQAASSQVPTALRNFSLSQKEKTIDELVHDKWLCQTSDGGIGLGVRSYLDLRSWFHSSGIPSCEVCNEAAIKAKMCQSEGCTFRIHHYCLKKKLSQSRGKFVCPTCDTQWDCQFPKLEVEAEDEPNDPVESRPPVGSKRKRLKTNRNGDSGNAQSQAAGCGSSQPSQSVSDLRRETRSSARLR